MCDPREKPPRNLQDPEGLLRGLQCRNKNILARISPGISESTNVTADVGRASSGSWAMLHGCVKLSAGAPPPELSQ